MATTHSQHVRRQLSLRVVKVARWLHIYASMLGLAAVLFFSATGITLNHPDWFFGERASSTSAEGTIDLALLHVKTAAPGPARPPSEPSDPAEPAEDPPPPDLSAEVAKLEVVEALRTAHGIGGALVDFKVDEQECSVTFKGPGYSADAFIDRESGKYTLTESRHGVVAVLNDLHKGRDTGPVWSAVIDVSAVVLVFISLTGLILLFYLKLRRVPGVVVAIAGTLLVLALYYWGVP
ncbi:hypothetical protein OJF2_45950 [Aquisphaera giovannonii]|uniref:PepSY-associated TM helix n=1 Tax=Aquisphaera giovannonii TaxID=406548 RepID=A0A5B9W6S8_9BACT|nr:PepSY-associated TM helix domain-containing protein [Aquisphaera giovannonii]QEH36037.1 hypothetical protein OJF2_45950 [Aquisphaera giovannonii]